MNTMATHNKYNKGYKDFYCLKKQKEMEDYAIKQELKIDRLKYELKVKAFNLADNLV